MSSSSSSFNIHRPSSAPRSKFDRPEIVSRFMTQKGIQCLAYNPYNSCALVGMASEAKIIRIDNGFQFRELKSLPSDKSPSFVSGEIVDVAWSMAEKDMSKCSLVYSSNEIHIYTIGQRAIAMTTSYSNITPKTIKINKIHWNPFDPNILAAGRSDGKVDFYDDRDSKKTMLQLGSSRGAISATNDLKFHPQETYQLVCGYDAGQLQLWDYRYPKDPLAANPKAHMGSITSLSWNTNGYLASASKDKSVKIWSLSHTNPNHIPTNNLLDEWVSTLYTPFIRINKLIWGNQHISSGNDATPNLTTTEQTNNSTRIVMIGNYSQADKKGHISIWDVNRPNIPLCILKGHSNSDCTGLECLTNVSALDTLTNTSMKQRKGRLSPPPSQESTSQTSSTPSSSAILCRNTILPPLTYVLSTSKDGDILIQDPRKGYFPYEHISPCVASLSSQGHLAYQISQPLDYCSSLTSISSASSSTFVSANSLPPSLPQTLSASTSTATTPNKPLTNSKPSSSKPIASSSSSSSNTKSPSTASSLTPSTATSTTASTTSTSSNPLIIQPKDINDPKQTIGKIYFGLAEFQTLQQVKEIRLKYGAEASVFDPALINVLAQNYSVGVDIVNISTVQSERMKAYQSATMACQHNFNIAEAAGLRCRSTIWEALQTLLPHPTSSSASSSATSAAFHTSEVSFVNDILANILSELLQAGDSQHFVLVAEILDKVNLLETILIYAKISRNQMDKIYYSYIELLTKLQLFCHANQILKSNTFHLQIIPKLLNPHTASSSSNHPLNEEEDADVLCRDIREDGREPEEYEDINHTNHAVFSPGNTSSNANSSYQQTTTSNNNMYEIRYRCCFCRGKDCLVIRSNGIVWCTHCQRCVSMCALCFKPITGVSLTCPVCNHAGHPHCLKDWFELRSFCPTGCGHQCSFQLKEHEICVPCGLDTSNHSPTISQLKTTANNSTNNPPNTSNNQQTNSQNHNNTFTHQQREQILLKKQTIRESRKQQLFQNIFPNEFAYQQSQQSSQLVSSQQLLLLTHENSIFQYYE